MNAGFGRSAAMAGSHVSHARTLIAVSLPLISFLQDRHSPETDCTFTSTRGQRIAGAPRTKILEDRLRRARALFSKLQANHPSAQLSTEVSSIFESPPGSPSSTSDTPVPTDDSSTDNLETMLDGRGRLTSINKSTKYYGSGSGFAFLLQTQQLLNHSSSITEEQKNDDSGAGAISRLFDSPVPDNQMLASEVPFSQLLPSRETTDELLTVVLLQSYQLLQFLQESTFRRQVDRLYDLDPMDLEDSDRDFLPLFHSVVALGYLFHQKAHKEHGCQGAVSRAMHHFIVAKRMVDLDRCQDIPSLQTLLCFILFLKSTARIATSHAYIGVAVAASMRMGLHSQVTCERLSDMDQDVRRRVFWTVVQLELYSVTVLGLPGMINLDYVDQLKPSGYIRDYENEDNEELVSLSHRQTQAASAQYLQLLRIIRKMMQRLYPRTCEGPPRRSGSHRIYVSNATISELEEDFRTWREGLADALGSPRESASLRRVWFELEMVYNFGHLLLYRPFLHFLTRTRGENSPDPRHLRCASSCVKISRLAISRSDEMLAQGYLAPAAWQSVYTVFLSSVILIVFLANQRGSNEYEAIQEETRCGIRILANTSCQDMGSRRCLDVLRVLTGRLSHIIDVDVDKVCTGAMPVCGNASFVPTVTPSQASTAAQSDEPVESQLPLRAKPTKAARANTTSKPKHQIPPSRPPTKPRPRSQAPQNVPPATVPAYEQMPYPMQLSMWESSMGVVAPVQEPYYDMNHLPYGTSPSPHPPIPMNPDAYGPPEMEVPYGEGFAWRFEPPSDTPGEGQEAGVGPHPVPLNRPVTHEDIAAFMQLHPGEPFR